MRSAPEPVYALYKRRIRELLKPPAGTAYLEVGCGAGDDAVAVARESEATVVAIDASAAMVAEARRHGADDASRRARAAVRGRDLRGRLGRRDVPAPGGPRG